MTLWSWWDVKIRELTNKPCMGRMVERKINWSIKRKWEWNVRICGQSVRQWQSLMFSYQSCMSRILPHQCFVHWLPCFDFYLFFSSSLFFAHWNVFFLLSKVSQFLVMVFDCCELFPSLCALFFVFWWCYFFVSHVIVQSRSITFIMLYPRVTKLGIFLRKVTNLILNRDSICF